ncbi:protein kinase domain-containing protein [Simkania sp.]|uniref:protein kinase domain-containing protein n=1 Tax=Simkania sp. TaxID=34094 RepID=UPI003B52F000
MIHRDLKPANILITADGQIKILDYGLSRACKEDEEIFSPFGSPVYVAPEIIFNDDSYEGGYDEKVDVWSFGVLFYRLAFGEAPFRGGTIATLVRDIIDFAQNNAEGLEQISDRFPTDLERYPLAGDENFRDFLNKIFCKPEDRLSMKEVLEHPFLMPMEEALQNVSLVESAEGSIHEAELEQSVSV